MTIVITWSVKSLKCDHLEGILHFQDKKIKMMERTDSLEDIENALDQALLSQRRLKNTEDSNECQRKETPQYSFIISIFTECMYGFLW